ncbi:hypothetical protein UFOVP233_65 [uncultured Caudovirales phage]|uniref:Uncharacterized protein n=1 Tax=uncultured Caudovirales phage TaxID=2100421 RepID=A0A6J7WW81_9CAUD|nr:hypothetical protein UFOVP233_65 [uncultured Caudovirales phage]
MGKFLSLQQTAAALIAKAGSAVVLRRPKGATFDPITQQETGGGEDLYTFVAVFLPPSQQAKFAAQSLEQGVSLEGYFAMKGQTITPFPGDIVNVGGVDYKLFWAQTYDPAQDGPIFTHAYLER